MKKKIIFISMAFILIIALSIFLIFFSQKKCVTDSDCSINNCCNPTECILKEKAPSCSSIVVCPTEPKTISCKCINGKCAR